MQFWAFGDFFQLLPWLQKPRENPQKICAVCNRPENAHYENEIIAVSLPRFAKFFLEKHSSVLKHDNFCSAIGFSDLDHGGVDAGTLNNNFRTGTGTYIVLQMKPYFKGPLINNVTLRGKKKQD